jgi:hypothetical protein
MPPLRNAGRFWKKRRRSISFFRSVSGVPSALHAAAHIGNIEVCRALMEAGADNKEARDDKQMTPLHVAAMKRNIDV